jgi:hypothetical protein
MCGHSSIHLQKIFFLRSIGAFAWHRSRQGVADAMIEAFISYIQYQSVEISYLVLRHVVFLKPYYQKEQCN